ncbi:hypothetical protein [Bradyrhizobium erythrophlei]|uniref:Uncharacterized protein n=1 Tax=Bradyrhizobium erythrophlei TaxID=1437360 RepID=A0A1M5PSB4_9BRAD|nr:hypothetical protein [Bradyrhizobium erythrophlei]SHH04734.1 hypothetical protein SAMN05443248_3492 [Bradyrhizobium erythrophlei]
MREVVTGFCSPWSVDDGENDCVSVTIYGPGGGTRFSGIMYPIQARKLMNQLDLALTRINDHHARLEEAQCDSTPPAT